MGLCGGRWWLSTYLIFLKDPLPSWSPVFGVQFFEGAPTFLPGLSLQETFLYPCPKRARSAPAPDRPWGSGQRLAVSTSALCPPAGARGAPGPGPLSPLTPISRAPGQTPCVREHRVVLSFPESQVDPQEAGQHCPVGAAAHGSHPGAQPEQKDDQHPGPRGEEDGPCLALRVRLICRDPHPRFERKQLQPPIPGSCPTLAGPGAPAP